MTERNWTVFVDDHFNYQNEDERYTYGVFDSLEAAIEACKEIVDRSLQNSPAETAEKLYDVYLMFGEDPWIKGPDPESGARVFSSSKYALQRCKELRPQR